MIGSLINFISNKNQIFLNQNKNKFQPMPASFGLVPELSKKIKDKRLRYKAYQERSTESLNEFKNKLDTCFEKNICLAKFTKIELSKIQKWNLIRKISMLLLLAQE